MRQIRYAVAMSLDGYIADPKGGFDWIVQDPDMDFAAKFAKVDTLLMGRRTYDLMKSMSGAGGGIAEGMSIVVVSRTLKQRDHPHATILFRGWREAVRKLRAKPGKDIWLFGGGELFRSMLEADLVDSVDVAIIPLLLGGGIPLLPPPAPRASLRLVKPRTYETSG